ncbi:MAG TPA: hypothetical protein VJJ22_01555 [Candidatus Paceibacterota bacterium]
MEQQAKTVYVDGLLIRNTLDLDFNIVHINSSEIGYFSPKFYIPRGEVWLDYHHKNEQDFLIKVVDFEETRDLTLNQSYEKVRKLMKETLCLTGPIPELKLRSEKAGENTIIYVDGSLVRKYLDPEFVMGGHNLVYDYVPVDEIWIDTMEDSVDQKYTLLHEETELALMKTGKSYDISHEYAIVTEKEARRKNGLGHYPGDNDYPWRGQSNEKIITKYHVN